MTMPFASHDPEKACPREGGGCRLFGQDHAQKSMIPKSCRLFGQDHAQNQREIW
jgi:hypothetical protein